MKLSIVTPVYNGEKYIAETIESILSQEGEFEIEYVIADGASTDGTLAIVKSYEDRLASHSYPIGCNGVTFSYFSAKDHGMYDAIDKGFARTTGDVLAYLNADDRYLPGAFKAVSTILTQYPDIEWVKGINTTSDESGKIIAQGTCFLYRQDWLRKGIYGRSAYFVQQDSVFWRRSLWQKSHPAVSAYRLAGDYALWKAFAVYAPLWSFNRRVSVFRRRPGQLSADITPYRQEQARIAPHYFYLEKRVVLFFSLVRGCGLNPTSGATRLLWRTFFPFTPQQKYIDFNLEGQPMKRKAVSYMV
jgi:glycosyltransferase involved in cell wall biosynthesis